MVDISMHSRINELLGGSETYLPLLEYFSREAGVEFPQGEDTAEKVRKARMKILVSNAFMSEEFKRINVNFAENGIQFLLLKGLMMEILYPPGTRPFSDIDLLVRKQDIERAGRILSKMGFEENIEPRQGLVQARKNAGFSKKGRLPVMVECHYRLGPCPYLDRPSPYLLLRDSAEYEIYGMRTRGLSPEDILIHLALHAFSHIPAPCAISLCDIRQVICLMGKKINWESFISKVEKDNLWMPVRMAFKRGAETLDIPFPTEVMEMLCSFIPGLVERARFTLLQSPSRSKSNMGKLSFGMRTVRKLRLTVYMVFPSKRYLEKRYGKKGNVNLLVSFIRYSWEGISSAASWFRENFIKLSFPSRVP